MKIPQKRFFEIDFETALCELYIIHKDLKTQLMNDESFNQYFYFLLEFVYNNLLERNNLKDSPIVREQYSSIIAQELNDLYKSEYIVANSNHVKNIIKDFISDKNSYFYVDNKTNEGIEFFIIKEHEIETLNYLGLIDNYYFIDNKPLRYTKAW